MAHSTCQSGIASFKPSAKRRVYTASGEPSGSHTLAYFSADLGPRIGRITPYSSGFQNSGGIATTRRSLRNSAR